MGAIKNQQAMQAQLVSGHAAPDKNQQLMRLQLFTEDGFPVDIAESFEQFGTLVADMQSQIADLNTRVTALEGA